MNHNTNNGNEWYQPSTNMGVGIVAAALVTGLAVYNQDNIANWLNPKQPPVAQVYNNDSCLAYNGKTYVLKNEIARNGDGIERLILRHNPSVTSELGAAFKVANSGRKFFSGSGLYERKQYLTPAPDKGNKCK